MEIKNNRREKSLKLFFVQFLFRTVGYILAAVVIGLVLFGILVNKIDIIPANELEQKVLNWVKESENQGELSFDTFPKEAGYVLFNEQGNIKKSYHMSEKKIEAAKKLYQSKNSVSYNPWTNYRYQILKDANCVVGYTLRAQFCNLMLQRIFPNPDVLFFLGLIIFVIVAIVLSIYQTANRMEKNIKKLQSAATEIQKQNLDFPIEWTNMKEFNGVLLALDELRNHLTESLQKQWKLEQDKKTQMSALAHDIKTPLTIILGNAELLQESEIGEEEQEYTQSIYQNSKQIQRYVSQIIELSKNMELEMPNETIEARPFFENVLKDAKTLAELKHIKIMETIRTDTDYIYGNEEGLKRVFNNIFDNAVRYTEDHKTITFTMDKVVYEDKSYMECRIMDSGKGFSKQAILRATEQFYQEDASRTSREHFGIGLYIAKQIIAGCGGKIELSNAEHGGAVVKLWIPCSK